MEFITDYRLEDFVLQTQWEDLPQQVQERAVGCGVDLMTALLLGSRGRQFAAGVKLAHKTLLPGDLPVVGSADIFSFLGATVAMSHASNSFDIDDGHNMIKGHPGTSFVAGVLSAALEQGCTWEAYLTTLVVCYEVAVRCGLAQQDHYGYLHSTGTYGALGTAAGVGRLFGLNREQLNNALSIAEFHAPMTPVMRSVEHPSMNKDGVPFGALTGAMAVLETQCGSTGVGNLLETPEYRHLLDSLGQTWEIMNLYFKPYTCCRWAHQPIAAIQSLMAQNPFTADQVESAVVHTFDAAARLSKKRPVSTDEAQYNIAWPVAAALVHGDLGYLQVREEALDDKDVLAMMKCLTFIMDPALEAEFPEKRQARIEIALKDGAVLRSEIFEAPGEAKENISLQWLCDKFRRVTAPVVSTEKQETLLKLMTGDKSTPVRMIVQAANS